MKFLRNSAMIFCKILLHWAGKIQFRYRFGYVQKFSFVIPYLYSEIIASFLAIY